MILKLKQGITNETIICPIPGSTLALIIRKALAQSYKTFLMLNSTKHEISTAHKY